MVPGDVGSVAVRVAAAPATSVAGFADPGIAGPAIAGPGIADAGIAGKVIALTAGEGFGDGGRAATAPGVGTSGIVKPPPMDEPLGGGGVDELVELGMLGIANEDAGGRVGVGGVETGVKLPGGGALPAKDPLDDALPGAPLPGAGGGNAGDDAPANRLLLAGGGVLTGNPLAAAAA